MEKSRRQSAILKLVQKAAVESQMELVDALASQGFEVTQASVSRDTRELGLVKVGGRYILPAEVRPIRPDSPPAARVLTSATAVGANLIVAKTPPGGAPMAASFLDQARRPELVGCVAGDDTIFLAVKSRSDQGRLLAWLKSFSKGGI